MDILQTLTQKMEDKQHCSNLRDKASLEEKPRTETKSQSVDNTLILICRRTSCVKHLFLTHITFWEGEGFIKSVCYKKLYCVTGVTFLNSLQLVDLMILCKHFKINIFCNISIVRMF